jgi:hypothetical protein
MIRQVVLINQQCPNPQSCEKSYSQQNIILWSRGGLKGFESTCFNKPFILWNLTKYRSCIILYAADALTLVVIILQRPEKSKGHSHKNSLWDYHPLNCSLGLNYGSPTYSIFYRPCKSYDFLISISITVYRKGLIDLHDLKTLFFKSIGETQYQRTSPQWFIYADTICMSDANPWPIHAEWKICTATIALKSGLIILYNKTSDIKKIVTYLDGISKNVNLLADLIFFFGPNYRLTR